MKKLVIAEKPSVGREIAKTLHCLKRENGYSEGDEYIITWALGHLVELAEPQAYSEKYRRWNLNDLPMLPEALKEEVIEETHDQFDIIASLLGREDVGSVVIATDAGREGELVARWILKKAGWSGKTERLWISSQTEAAILDGFANLESSDNYDNLYRAAECRAAADWYVGMNVTRALTCFYDAKLSSGRVQTPTLALMTKREDERDLFLGSYYYSCRASFGLFSASYYPDESTIRFTSDDKAKELEGLKGRKGRVVEIRKEEKVELVPLAYDLTELQRDANTILGLSAKETLDTLQRLYEVHKIVTYPRTDSRCITSDIVPTLRDRLKAIEATEFSLQVDEYLASGYREDNPRFVDDSRVSDHHALLPTEQRVDKSKLTATEAKLWALIAKRFLECLGADRVYETTTVRLEVEQNSFMLRSSRTIRPGWHSVGAAAGMKSSDETELADNPMLIASLKEGSEVEVVTIRVKKNVTTPPERYTDATLLSAMEHAGRFVEDEEIKGNLSSGLGTPATRADMIEKLVANRYVIRDGKYLVPTEKGREVVRLAPRVLQSAELTGIWEGRLENISRGKEDPSLFIKDIKAMAKELVSEVAHSTLKFEPSFKDGKRCPYCGGEMMRAEDSDGSIHYICQRISCSYEEREVRLKKESPLPSARKTVVTSDGKIKVVISKGLKVPKAIYETRLEVVRESKRKGRVNSNVTNSSRERYFATKEGDSGSTMADFFKLSEKRQEERRSKTRK